MREFKPIWEELGLPSPTTVEEPDARIAYLRDFLWLMPEEKFDMGEPGNAFDFSEHECGTPACIAGWARALFANQPIYTLPAVGDLLGIDRGVATDMFYPAWVSYTGHICAYKATAKQAGDMLDVYLKTRDPKAWLQVMPKIPSRSKGAL